MKSKTRNSLAFAGAATLVLFLLLSFSVKVDSPKIEKFTQFDDSFIYQESVEKNDSKKAKSSSFYESQNLQNAQNVQPDFLSNSAQFLTQIDSPDFSLNSELNSSFGISNFSVSSSENANFGIKAFELAQLDKVPRRLAQGKIEYPESLLKRGIEGEVRALVFINKDGSAELAEIKFATNELFAESAKKLIPTLKFEIPLVAGKPVRAKFILPIPFKIVK